MENYKTTKTIRFKLEADEKNILNIKNDVEFIETKNREFDLVAFVSKLNNYLYDLEDYLYFEKEDGNAFFKEKMVIKRDWLRQYAKQEFAEFLEKKTNKETTKRREQITIADIAELSLKIEKSFDDVLDVYEELVKCSTAELNERAKRAKIGLLLKRLYAKNSIPFLSALVENTSDKNETDDLSTRLKQTSLNINSLLLLAIQAYLPEQSNGLPIAKASFNFYTINKKPVDYDDKIKKLEKNLIIDVENGIKSIKTYLDINRLYDNRLNDFFKFIYDDIAEELLNKKVLLIGETPLQSVTNYANLRQILKNIKSKQKIEFSEMLQKETSYEQLKQSNLYLFNKITPEQFYAYNEKTKELLEFATKLSNKNLSEDRKKLLRTQKQKIAKDRGNIMKNEFQYWKNFADFYRKIAQKHGKLFAQLKGIEKEKVESQLLKYWALIVEEKKRHKLILIPKEKASECKKWLENLKNEITIENQNIKFNWFESLTYRSLQKLCFGFVENNNNEFNQNIKNLLPRDENDFIINGEFAFKADDQKKIEFYKKVLNCQYAKQVLDFPIQQVEKEIIEQSFENLEDFKTALEKICYRRFVVSPQEIENELKKYDAQIFDITSLDLQNSENVKDKPQIFEHTDKNHTQIWKNFWTTENETDNFNIRLNPEITITYRQPKQSRIDKYGKDSDKKNRYLHSQYTLVTTISEHSNSPEKNLSFITDTEYKVSIEKFNRNFKKEDIKFAFGIDNGEVELSTLGIYLPDFEKTTNEEIIAELKQVEKYGFEVLTINNLNYKEIDINGNERKIILNPSYFLKKENYLRTFNKSEQDYQKMFALQFRKEHILTLDLTTAKVICGQIVTNGDVRSLFNLWLKHAQRNIFEMNDHTKKETAKNIKLRTNNELTEKEKIKFVEFISDKKELKKLTDDEKTKYITWILEDREKNKFTDAENRLFNKCQKKKGNFSSHIIFASRFEGEELENFTPIFECRHIFKKRSEFEAINTEEEIKNQIDSFNTNRTSHNISNEELDLKITETKNAVVANAIGVIDYLYKQYKIRFNGDGLIIKEGFDTQKVAEDIEKFSGNIYRILERKLYQKFQNYGLVPPLGSLMAVRDTGINDSKTTEILRLGNIGFVSKQQTSGICPVCRNKNLRHGTVCPDCNNDLKNIIHSNDGIAGMNIAKRGLENFIIRKTFTLG